MQNKLSQWKASKLSLAGRHVLVQAALASIPSHVMQSVQLPVGVCDSLDQIQRDFLWGGSAAHRKTSLVRWEQIWQPKPYGGIGLRTSKDANQALLAKLGWRFAQMINRFGPRLSRPNISLKETSYKQKQRKTHHTLGKAFLVRDK